MIRSTIRPDGSLAFTAPTVPTVLAVEALLSRLSVTQLVIELEAAGLGEDSAALAAEYLLLGARFERDDSALILAPLSH